MKKSLYYLLLVFGFILYSCSQEDSIEELESYNLVLPTVEGPVPIKEDGPVPLDDLIGILPVANCPGIEGEDYPIPQYTYSYIVDGSITNPTWSITGNATIISGGTSNTVTIYFASNWNGGELKLSGQSNGLQCTVIMELGKGSPPPPPCNDDCGNTFSGYYGTTSSYHIYPDKKMDVKCVATGKRISIYVNPSGVPNRFRIVSATGSTVADSGWLGTANYWGPWGISLNKSGKYLYLNKSSSSSYYLLKVETATPSNQTDSWSATLSCQ